MTIYCAFQTYELNRWKGSISDSTTSTQVARTYCKYSQISFLHKSEEFWLRNDGRLVDNAHRSVILLQKGDKMS
jgi:hypothetical protein